jgi:hypothetical protein
VSGGKVTVAADVAIVVKKSNVTGTLKKQTKTGVVNLSDGVLNLHPKNANYGIGVSVKDGSYDLYLPDGEYQIEGYWDQNTQEFKSLPVTFEVSGGKVDQPDALNLIVKLDNVKGSAKVEGNGGATDLESAWLNLHPIGGNYGFGTKIKDGLWALYLEDGDYQVDGYWNEKTQEYTPVTVKFSVQNGAPTDESLLDLMIKSNNVSGTLKKQSGSSYVNVSNAWLNLHPVNGNVGMNASVKNGVFALYLPDGDYQVEGYWDQVNQVYVPVTATFTVDNGKLTDIKALDLKVRENNVTGILKNDAGAALSNAWLNITQINGDTRANVPVKNGAFELYLPNGKYQVDGYWDAENEVYVPMTTKFEVKNGVLVGSAPLKLAPNKINVSGTLSKDDGDGPYALTDVWVNISNPDTGELFTVLVNEGEFSLYLPNGNYDIDGYFNEATGEFVSLLGSFEVAGGKVTDETESELTIVSQNSNIEGTVEDASGDTLDGVWMTLVEENGEGTEDDRQINVYVEDGKFDAFLDDNTYTMDGYWSEDGETYTELDGTFTVDGGEVADDGGGIVEDAQQ